MRESKMWDCKMQFYIALHFISCFLLHPIFTHHVGRCAFVTMLSKDESVSQRQNASTGKCETNFYTFFFSRIFQSCIFSRPHQGSLQQTLTADDLKIYM